MTVGEEFDDYRRVVIPKTAPQIQLDESRRAFYAGAAAMACLMGKVAELPEDSIEQKQFAEILFGELQAFAASPYHVERDTPHEATPPTEAKE